MSENRRVFSIARRINLAWFWRLVRAFFWIDMAVILLALAVFCYHAEVTAPGGFDWATQRWVSADWSRDALSVADSAVYHFTPVEGAARTIPLGDFLRLVLMAFQYLIYLEGFFLLTQLLFGARGARRLLKPLQKLALTAQRLSEAQRTVSSRGFDEQKFHNLEDAIEALAPNQPDARLAIGDSDLKGLEGAINGLLKRMHESYQQQSRFVSDASHELRTPIAVIQGYAAMLDRWGKNDENVLNESIAAIKSESEHMKKLVEQLLFLARGDSGRQRLTFVKVSLTELMSELCEEYGMIDPKHVWKLDAAPDVTCVADADMIKQVARILADNALKYTPEGGEIKLRAAMRGGHPVFEVQDTGAGISAGDAPHVFERFYRAASARGEAPGGTGLGLSIAKWIVDQHRGYFELTSREGLGTRIAVHLPETQF